MDFPCGVHFRKHLFPAGLRGARSQPAPDGRHRAGGGGTEETLGGCHGAEGRWRLSASALLEAEWRGWDGLSSHSSDIV